MMSAIMRRFDSLGVSGLLTAGIVASVPTAAFMPAGPGDGLVILTADVDPPVDAEVGNIASNLIAHDGQHR